MSIGILLLIHCIRFVFSEQNSRSDTRSGYITSDVGSEGSWSSSKFCNDGVYATGYRLKIDNEDPSSNNYKAAIDFRLKCEDGEGITADNGLNGGTLQDWVECTAGTKLNGLKTRIDLEGSELNDIEIDCSADNSEDRLTGISTEGRWGSMENCPVGSMVCGWKQRVDTDTGINSIRLYCCDSETDLTETISTSCDLASVGYGEDYSCSIDVKFGDDEPIETTTLMVTNEFNLNARCDNPRITYSYFDNAGYLEYFDSDLYIKLYEGYTRDDDEIKTCSGSLGQCNYKSCVTQKSLNDNYLDSSLIAVTINIPQTHDSKSCSENAKKVDSILTLTCSRGAPPIVDSLGIDAITWSDSSALCNGDARYSSSSGWCSQTTDTTTYLEIDLGATYFIHSVGTKGRADTNSYVTEYNLLYSMNGIDFIALESNPIIGNTNNMDENIISLKNKYIIAQYLRFIPTAYSGEKAMRMEVYGEENKYIDIDQVGSITINGDGTIEENTGSLNVENLYCGTEEDEAIWGGLLALNQDILSKLQAIKGEEAVLNAMKFMECSELVYHAIVQAAIPGPVRLLDVANLILKELQNIPIVGDKVENSMDEISEVIVDLLNVLTPDIVNLDWNDKWEPDGTIFNPFDEVKSMATMLSNLVCKNVVGEDLETIILGLRDSDAMIEIKNDFRSEIYDLLTNNGHLLHGVLNSDTRTSLLDGTPPRYQDFTIVFTVGMQICFAKSMEGCVSRMLGVSMDLNDNSQIFESRSMSLNIPSLSVGIGAKGFAHFDFLGNYLDVINTELTLNVGIMVQTPPIPGSDDISILLEKWQTHSDKLGKIPFVSDSLNIGDKISFIDGILDENAFLIEILLGGANAKLSIIYGLGDVQLLNCNGFRLDLSIGDINSFGFAVFFGFEYRKESGIKQGLDWIYDIDTGNFKEFWNILLDISSDTINIFDDAIDSIGDTVEDLGVDIANTVENKILDVVNHIIDQVEYVANIVINQANDIISDANGIINNFNSVIIGPANNAISSFNSAVIGPANSAISTVNNKISTTNDEMDAIYGNDGTFDKLSDAISTAKSGCKDINKCKTFDIGVYKKKVCVDDLIGLNSICNDIFSPVSNKLDNLDEKLNDIPNLPTLQSVNEIDLNIPTIDLNIPSINTVEIGNISPTPNSAAKTINIINVDKNNKNDKKDKKKHYNHDKGYKYNNIPNKLNDDNNNNNIFIISPTMILIFIIYTFLTISIGCCLGKYIYSNNNKNGFKMVNNYSDTDTQI